jgi:PAS domain S-box-containing protein
METGTMSDHTRSPSGLLAAVEEARRKGELLSTLRKEPLLWLALRYGLAVAAVAAGFGVYLALTVWVGPGLPPFILLYPALIVVALLAGFGPGLVATGLTMLLVDLWILPPIGQFPVASPVDRLALTLFAFNGLLITAVAELYRRDRQKVADYEREAAASRSQKTFVELVERSPFGTYIVDSQFRVAMMNAASKDGAFRNVRPVIGRDFSDVMRILWPDDVAAEIIAHFRHTLDAGEPYFSRDFVNPRHDAEIVEAYEWELHRMTLPDGQHGVICYYYDSTRLREAEAAVRASEERFRVVQELSPDGFSILRPVRDPERRVVDFTWVYANPATESIVGVKRPALAGRSLLELFPGHRGSPLLDAYRKVAETGQTQIEEARYESDAVLEHRWFRVAVVPMGQDIAVLSQDITERKRSEQAVKEAERRFSTIFERSPMAMSLATVPENILVSVNDAFLEMFGYSHEEVIGHVSVDLGIWDGAEPSRQEARDEFRSKGCVRGFECVLPTETGRKRWLLHNSDLVTVDGQPYVLTTSEDITARKQAEEALHASNQELEEFNQAMVGRELRMIELKQEINAACARFGLPPRYAPDGEEVDHE